MLRGLLKRKKIDMFFGSSGRPAQKRHGILFDRPAILRVGNVNELIWEPIFLRTDHIKELSGSYRV